MGEDLITIAQGNLKYWDAWSIASKTFAVVIGSFIAGGIAAVSSKKLPDFWHYLLISLIAACAYAWNMLQPYEEYKQFRKAYAIVEKSLNHYIVDKNSEKKREILIESMDKARFILEETWATPDPSSPHK